MRHRHRIRSIDAHLNRGDQLMIEIRDAVRDVRAEFELNRAEHELNRAEHELNRRELERNREANGREFELNRREFERNRQETQNGREVMRELVAEIRAMREEGRRHSDAVVGALTDLAAEIRGWGGGAAPAG